MIVAADTTDVRRAVREARSRSLSVGCVPTMGALHVGHVSLIEAARNQCRFVAVTIFVNPTQFAPGEDFTKYPRPLEADLDLCRQSGVDLVYVPTPETLYPPNFGTFVDVAPLSGMLEGAFQSRARSPLLVSKGTSSRISTSPISISAFISPGSAGENFVLLDLVSRKVQRRRIALSRLSCASGESGWSFIFSPSA